jgi:sulfate-transporting ATPase
MSPVQRARLGIGRTFQSLELFEDMTIGDNLAVASDSRLHSLNLHGPFRHKQRTFAPAVQAAIRHFGLEDHLGNLPSDLDHARRSWVAIARVLATSPRLLMLDEPAAGMDARGRAELGRALRKLADTSRIGVLLIEHDIEFVFSFCDRVVVMDMGEIICSGDPAEVRENPRLIAAYLGAASADDAMAPGERPADANPS